MHKKYNKYFIDQAMQTMSQQKNILDVGGGIKFGKWLSAYKALFAHCNFKNFDYDEKTGADIIGDIHNLPLADNSIDGVICSSVLEHVANPALAISEIRRILKPNGLLFIYVPSTYPYHSRPGHYLDYWRFFDDTINLLLKDFHDVQIEKQGGYFIAMSFFVPLQHKLRWLLDPAAHWLDHLFNTNKKHTTAGYYVLASK